MGNSSTKLLKLCPLPCRYFCSLLCLISEVLAGSSCVLYCNLKLIFTTLVYLKMCIVWSKLCRGSADVGYSVSGINSWIFAVWLRRTCNPAELTSDHWSLHWLPCGSNYLFSLMLRGNLLLPFGATGWLWEDSNISGSWELVGLSDQGLPGWVQILIQ